MEGEFRIPTSISLQRCSFYESVLLCAIHLCLLLGCQSVVSYRRVMFAIVSWSQIVFRIIGYKSSNELISTWFYEREGVNSFGLSYVFYIPQIFFLSLLINHEHSYEAFVGSVYAKQLVDYLYFSYWLYLLAVMFLLFHQLVYRSKILNAIILTGIWIAFYYGFYRYHFFYCLLAYSFGYLTFIGAKYIKHTWSFGEYSMILLALVTVFVVLCDNTMSISKYRFTFNNLTTNTTINNNNNQNINQNNNKNNYTDAEWIETLQVACGILFSNVLTVVICVLLLLLKKKYFVRSIFIANSLLIVCVAMVSLNMCVSISTRQPLLTIIRWFLMDFMNKQYRWCQFGWCMLMALGCGAYTLNRCFYSSVEVKTTTTTSTNLFNFNPKICIQRKVFHLILSCTLIPLLCVDDQFTLLATTCLLTLFIMLEMVRIFNADQLAYLYYCVIKYFLDDRDNGSVVVSHVNLLIGTSFPIWTIRSVTFDPKTDPILISAYRTILMSCGLISIGIGDSIACIFGIKYGKNSKKILDSNKTIVGMMASFIAQFATFFLLFYVKIYFKYSFVELLLSKHTLTMLYISFLSSMLELLITQNDNLMIPLVIFPLIAFFV